MGKRFGGNAFIGSVPHIIEKNEWITKAGIGIDPGNITDRSNVESPSAAGLHPGMEGLHTAVAKRMDGDPAEERRIQVELPWLEGDSKLLSTLYATGNSGTFGLPGPDDEVLVGFANNGPTHLVILGGMYSGKHKSPYEYTAENQTKDFVTSEKLRIEFDERYCSQRYVYSRIQSMDFSFPCPFAILIGTVSYHTNTASIIAN